MAAEPLQPNMTLEASNQPSEVRDLEEAKDTMLEAYRLLRAAGDVQAAADAIRVASVAPFSLRRFDEMVSLQRRTLEFAREVRLEGEEAFARGRLFLVRTAREGIRAIETSVDWSELSRKSVQRLRGRRAAGRGRRPAPVLPENVILALS